ncbi:MAG: alpha/beta hydrolase [Firmicutes bacterium]|nr:alpha/beta hydrolase [Bacillota bacterium]
MFEFTVDTPFQEIYDLPEVKPFIPYFVGKRPPVIGLPGEATLRERNRPDPNRDIYAQCDGVNHLLRKIFNGEKILYDVYTEQEIAENPEKAPVKLLYFRADAAPTVQTDAVPTSETDAASASEIDAASAAKKPFALLCAGGGYGSVCSVIEGFSTAQELNALGYPVFLLNYRVGYANLLPDPFDDLAAAIRYILANAEELGVSAENYAVGGFSAGGHLAAEWGSDNYGYTRYGLPKPAALFLIYPVIYSWLREGQEEAMDRIYGGHTPEVLERFAVHHHLWAGYPATFLVHCKDDPEVPVKNSLLMQEGLTGLGIPNELLLGEIGGHGFGSGRSTSAAGWTSKAAAFWKKQMR